MDNVMQPDEPHDRQHNNAEQCPDDDGDALNADLSKSDHANTDDARGHCRDAYSNTEQYDAR
jgi:hypothetical protein